MIIGVPKEIKEQENRVALTPAGVDALVREGHTVYIESGAGSNSNFSDDEYRREGGIILKDASEVWNRSQLIVKVKEPLESEFKFLREGLIIFTYFHLAAFEDLTRALLESGAVAIAYETVQREDGFLPLLAPMSEIAGRMAIQHGANHLETIRGGKGMLIDGVPGVKPAEVVIVGAGNVGSAALKRAVGLGCRVTILDINIERLKYLADIYGGRIETVYSNNYNIMEAVKTADLVIGAVLIPGSKAPKVITEDMVKAMEKGTVIIDIAIDQGGAVETIDKPTTHDNPTFIKHDVIHYAVANVPGAVARTGTLALTNVTLTYILDIANKGWKKAFRDDPALARGGNIIEGKIVNKGVASAFDLAYSDLKEVLS